MGERLLRGDGVPFWGDENAWELDRSVRTGSRVPYAPLTCSLSQGYFSVTRISAKGVASAGTSLSCRTKGGCLPPASLNWGFWASGQRAGPPAVSHVPRHSRKRGGQCVGWVPSDRKG